MDKLKKLTACVLSFAMVAGMTVSYVSANSTNYLRGDVDGDGIVDLSDLAYMANFLSGKKCSANERMSKRLDVDLSGVIDKLDKSMLSNIVIGNITSDTINYDTLASGIPGHLSRSYYKYDAQTGLQIDNEYTLSQLNSIPDQSPRDIFYPDSRVEDYSKNGIVKLTYRRGVNLYNGTGFIVGDHLILTAAHCTFNTVSNTPSSQMTYTTFNSDGTVDSTHDVVSYHLPSDFINSSEPASECDYALLVVDEDLSDYDQFELGVSRDMLKNVTNSTVYKTTNLYGTGLTNIYVTGYDSSLNKILTGKGYFTAPYITDGSLFYDTDTESGESGSPVYLETNNGEIVVIGIHSKGTTLYNQCKRIGTDVLYFVYNNPNL